MNCPLFVDFTRHCIKEVKNLPADTLGFCLTEKHVDCPFYRVIQKVGCTCENITGCPVFDSIKFGDFPAFVQMTKNYCLCENKVNCRRYILKKQDVSVPEDLLPDGRSLG